MASENLELLYDPTDAVVDIVFVHGLCGGRNKTWTHDQVFWPKDLLPTDIPKARILAFGYDANYAHFWGPPAQNKINHHANRFFQSLVEVRDQTDAHERPIILVAHSLGGLLCAQALISADDRAKRNISKRTRSIAFFGTPLRSSANSTWAQVGRSFMDYVDYKDTDGGLERGLDENSEQLSELGEKFSDLLRRRANIPDEKIEIQCFFEGEPFPIPGTGKHWIVPEASACLPGYPSCRIPANHSDMCKFRGPDDESYQKVSKVLREWARELEELLHAKEVSGNPVTTTFSGHFFGSPTVGQAQGGSHIAGGSVTFRTTYFGTTYFGATRRGSDPPESY